MSVLRGASTSRSLLLIQLCSTEALRVGRGAGTEAQSPSAGPALRWSQTQWLPLLLGRFLVC